ncbi:MAG: TetR/AcrR family transcriptional regulator [Oscillospiraceae bacterium]|nr:TetR/AcrR family transcriptional regulator [Oscillospiraceae bacterium]
MSTADKTIDPKILESAKAEFLSKPYKDVSLREVCKKAGVTTGALYKRFENKEALFDALVAPTLETVKQLCDSTESFNYDQLDKMDMKYVWDMTSETHKKIINIFYDDYDGFRLLLCHSDGTKYANFIHDFVDDVAVRSMNFMHEVHKKGISDFIIDDEEFHMLLTAYWSTMFEPIIHGLSRERALMHCEMIAKLFNWTAVLGF